MKFYSKDLRIQYGETLVELGEKYNNVLVLDADLCTSTMTSLFRERFPKRFIQCGIAEANMHGIAAGYAHMGYVVFPSTFAAFVCRKSVDPVYMNACLHNAPVKVSGSYPGLTAVECGASHNACEDIAIMSSLPNIKVLDPGDNIELNAAMHHMAAEPGAVYFRVSKGCMPMLFDRDYAFSWGKGRLLQEGKDITLISTGMMTAIAMKAAESLAENDISAQVVHMPSIKPIDAELIIACAKKTGCILTLENARAKGGLGSAVSDVVTENYPVYMEHLGLQEQIVGSDTIKVLLESYGLTPSEVVKSGMRLVKKKS